MSDHAIVTLFDEERRFPPDPAFAASANAGPEIYDRDFDEFWETSARERVSWFTPWETLYTWEAAVREVVPRRDAQRDVQLRRPPRRGRAGRSCRLPLGGGARGYADAHLRGAPARGRPLRERPPRARRREGHPGRDLHGHGPGAGDRDARLRPDRRAAHRGVRRVLRGLALRPDERLRLPGARHAGRGMAAWRPGPSEGDRRRGHGGLAERQAVPRRASARAARSPSPRAATAGTTSSSLDDDPATLSVRADGQRGPAVPDVHVGHHGEAQGHRPHHRRLPRRSGDHAPLRLRSEVREGRLLVRRRHRLDHRSQLHRLRPALQRGDVGALRGDTRTSPTGTAGGTSPSATARRSCTRAIRGGGGEAVAARLGGLVPAPTWRRGGRSPSGRPRTQDSATHYSASSLLALYGSSSRPAARPVGERSSSVRPSRG